MILSKPKQTNEKKLLRDYKKTAWILGSRSEGEKAKFGEKMGLLEMDELQHFTVYRFCSPFAPLLFPFWVTLM